MPEVAMGLFMLHIQGRYNQDQVWSPLPVFGIATLQLSQECDQTEDSNAKYMHKGSHLI